MKLVKETILNILFHIIAIPCSILFGIYLILSTPYDYIKYKRSPYWKKEKDKYMLFFSRSKEFNIYNKIANANIPISFIKDPRSDVKGNGWFVYDRTLIIVNWGYFEFDEHEGIWRLLCDACVDMEMMSLDEFIELELNEKNMLMGEKRYDDAVVLISEDSLSDVELGKEDLRFLVYKEDCTQILRQFCKRELDDLQNLEIDSIKV